MYLFAGFYLIGQSLPVRLASIGKLGFFSVVLPHLGVSYDTVCQLHSKILRTLTERMEPYLLRVKIHMDESGLCGALPGARQAAFMSENSFSPELNSYWAEFH